MLTFLSKLNIREEILYSYSNDTTFV